MLSPVSSTPTSGPIGRRLFLNKGQYRTCHIRVADVEERLPAILVDGKFYSFFKAVGDRNKALDVLAKLFDKGDEAVITSSPKAHALWVLELTAQLDRREAALVS